MSSTQEKYQYTQRRGGRDSGVLHIQFDAGREGQRLPLLGGLCVHVHLQLGAQHTPVLVVLVLVLALRRIL